ncbi:MAG: hotdog domain-containing protein [Isosphaeraceae bacterium]
MVFLAPVHPGERVEITAEVSYTGRTTVECHIVVHAEPLRKALRRKVGEGYGLYVCLDEKGRPAPVRPLLLETEAERARHEAAVARQAQRLARRETRLAGRVSECCCRDL